jgi:hypothetical protein
LRCSIFGEQRERGETLLEKLPLGGAFVAFPEVRYQKISLPSGGKAVMELRKQILILSAMHQKASDTKIHVPAVLAPFKEVSPL